MKSKFYGYFKNYGGRQYKIEAEYEEGRTIATIFLDATNPKYGIGQYQYSFKKQGYKLPDLGSINYKLMS